MRSFSGIYTTQRKKTKKYSIELPSSWEELQPGQFATAIYLFHVTVKADPEWIRLSLLTLLFEKHWPILEGISKEDRYTLLTELTRFFYEEEPPLKNFYPSITAKKQTLIPAATDLNNISFGEWCFLDTYFGFYLKDQNQKWLDRMIATVYRPRNPEADELSPDFTGDLRQPFNENLIPGRSAEINALDKPMKMAIFQWISIALKRVKEVRQDVFPQTQAPLDEEGNPLPLPETDPAENATWMDIFNDLIGPKFGNPDQLKQTNAMLVLDYLNKEQRTFKDMKRNL